MKGAYCKLNIKGMIFGILFSFCGFVSKSLLNDPVDMIHKLQTINSVPPLWIFNLLFLTFFFLLGYCAGSVIDSTQKNCNVGNQKIQAFRGGIYITCLFFLSLIWYPLFFLCGKIFLSLIVSVCAMMLAVMATVEWSRVRPTGILIIMSVCDLYIFYTMFISLSVFFSI